MRLPTWLRVAVPISLTAIALFAKLSPQSVHRLFGLLEPNDPFVSEHYEVVPGSMTTGDALRVFEGDREIAVQLCGIESAALDQSLGIEAKEALQTMVSQGDGHIILVPVSRSEDTAFVAEAFVSLVNSETELHLNSQIVADGLGRVSQKTVASCPNSAAILRAEEMAKDQALGVWAQPISQNP